MPPQFVKKINFFFQFRPRRVQNLTTVMETKENRHYQTLQPAQRRIQFREAQV